jgi:2-oxoglutarate ferredoxin oxidoreductase subunit beta
MTLPLETQNKSTWCPGCPNFMILAGLKKAIESTGKKREEFAMVTGIGCHAKIFDYLNLPGLNSLHGRVPPVALGLKLGNPKLNIIGISGDGDAYAEGLEHTIHAARYNSNWTYIIHNNQTFSLTTGQPTPVTEKGFIDKTTPLGVKTQPFNPIRMMLASGATFVARVFADIDSVSWVIKEAINHKGFAFVEILQPCLIFHKSILEYKSKLYSLEESGHDKTNYEAAMRKAEEFDYNTAKKIPTGIFYQVKKEVFEEQFPQLQKLGDKGWKGIKR